MASAIAFQALLSLLPLLSVSVAMLGWTFGGSEPALLHARTWLREYVPVSDSLIYDTLVSIKRDSGLFGALGLIGCLITGSALFTCMETAFNNIWGVPAPRHWLKQRAIAILIALISLALMLSSVIITTWLSYILNTPLREHLSFSFKAAGYLFPFLLSILMFSFLYWLVPNRRAAWRVGLPGAVFAGVGWEVAKHLFVLYLARFNNFNKVYGSAASIIILMVYSYYSSFILLIGAEIAAEREAKQVMDEAST